MIKLSIHLPRGIFERELLVRHHRLSEGTEKLANESIREVIRPIIEWGAENKIRYVISFPPALKVAHAWASTTSSSVGECVFIFGDLSQATLFRLRWSDEYQMTVL